MRYYKVYGYNANLSELWRLSKRRPVQFLMAIFLKLLKSNVLSFEQPDISASEYLPYEALEEIFPEVIEDLTDIKREIEENMYTLAFVQYLRTERTTGFNLVFISPAGDRYIPLLWGEAKSKHSQMREVRYAIISLDGAYNPVITTKHPSNFDPMPSSVYTFLPGKSMKELDNIHTEILKKRYRTPIGITSANIKAIVDKVEDISYKYFRSRGIYSEKYERHN